MAKNFLTETKELKARAFAMFNEIDQDRSLHQFDGRYGKIFKPSYGGADMWYTNIYNALYDIIEVFENEDLTFAAKGKLARIYLKEAVKELEDRRDEAFRETFSDWLTDQENNEDRYTEYEYPNGSTYTVYQEPTYDEFIENIIDQEYTFNYDEYNNCEEAIFKLGEAFGDIIEIYY